MWYIIFSTTLLPCRKLTPLKAIFFRIPHVFHLHIPYDGCTLTPTAWSTDNPVGDSERPHDSAGWICMAVSAEEENNPQGASDLHGSQAPRAGAPSGLVFASASAGGMDMNAHHIMPSWSVMGPTTHVDLGPLMACPMEGKVSRGKVTKFLSRCEIKSKAFQFHQETDLRTNSTKHPTQ